MSRRGIGPVLSGLLGLRAFRLTDQLLFEGFAECQATYGMDKAHL